MSIVHLASWMSFGSLFFISENKSNDDQLK